jgi:hypothetical protein
MTTQTSTFCKTCRKPKANFNCGHCEEAVCKSCAQFLEEGSFSFLPKVPEVLCHSVYCSHCHDENVAGPLDDYQKTMTEAKEVIFFTKEKSKLTGHLKRKEDPLIIKDCEDEEETVLRLAFLAAQGKFNCLLDVSISHRKIIVGSHKKTIFSGSGVPTNIDPSKVREY